MNDFTRILVLDDDHTRHKAFQQALIGKIVEHVTTAQEAIASLLNHPVEILFLDHDLGGKTMVASGKGTGYEVAKWLAEHSERMPKRVIVHSFNPVGAQNIKTILPRAEICPGAWASIK